jgi:hypothetical protein
MEGYSDTWHAIALTNNGQSRILPTGSSGSLHLNWKRGVRERKDAIFLLSTLSILWVFTCVPASPICLLPRCSLLWTHLLSPKAGAREGLIASSLSLVSALEDSGESIVRIFQTQVSPCFPVKDVCGKAVSLLPVIPPCYYSPCSSVGDIGSSFLK